MQINIIEPALKEAGGHFLDWCDKIGRHILQRFGTRPCVYVHREISPEALRILEQVATVTPLFSGQPHARPDQHDPISGELDLFVDQSQALAIELRQVERADIWFWQTLFGYQLSALALAGITTPIAALIHSPPEFMSPKLGKAIWRHGSLAARKQSLKINFGVTVPELIPLFSPLLDYPLRVMPLLVDGAPIREKKETLRRVGFFGYQIPRKGQQLLLPLAAELHAKGYDVIVQDSRGIVRGVNADRLQFFGFLDSLPDLIATCDLVILPYDPNLYRSIGSGIAWDAVALGVPVVAPAGTSAGKFIKDLGAGETFSSFDVAAICAAVELARQNYPALARGAAAASKNWSDHHGVERFVSAMLAGIERLDLMGSVSAVKPGGNADTVLKDIVQQNCSS